MLRPAFKTPAGAIPVQGNRELPIPMDFRTVASFEDDLSYELRCGEIDFIQSVFIDNADAAVNLTIQFKYGILQRIICPARCQGFFPVLVIGAVKFVASSASGLIIPVVWSNTKRPCQIWNCS